MSESSWLRLLDRVRADMPALLSDFLDELQPLQGYADGAVPQDDIERTALQAFGLFLERLADPTGSAWSSEVPEALGRRRARQGIRIDHFTEGVRINFRLLWRALHRAAQPDLVAELMENGERVLNVVERYATEVQAAYLDETQIMAQLHRTARERALAKLFSGNATAEELKAAAADLSLAETGVFELVAVDRAEPPVAVRAAQAAGEGLAYEDDELVYLFRLRRGVVDWPLARLEAPGAYLAHVPGVAALAPAARLARRMRRLGEKARLRTLREAFAGLVHYEIREHVAGFEEELVGGWYRASPGERARYIETLEAFMRSGSIKEAGDELFLHRNTVFKRLRAFHELTGLDVAVPRDAVIALVLIITAPGSQINTERQ